MASLLMIICMISISISNVVGVSSRKELSKGNFTDNNQSSCSSNQFRCSNGPCINREYRCNGLIECPLGDDEQSCPSLVKNDNCAYQCKESKRCLPRSSLCDGKIQCLLADDELHCNSGSTGKQPDEGSSASKLKSVDSYFEQPLVKKDPENQSAEHSINKFNHSKEGSDYVFVNFGPIINGDKNVNGDGNQLNNGNGNGNGNGNDSGNDNGNGNGNYANNATII